MSDNDKRIRPAVWAVVGMLAVLVIALAILEAGRRPPVAGPGADATADPAAPVAVQPQATERPRAAARPSPAVSPEEPPPYIEGLVYGEIDLREARELMPDNLYWQLGSPTKDPQVLADREEEKKRRNEEYGRVLSGDANEEEVQAYYDYRKRLSSDYLEFSEFMSRRFKNSSNEQFVGMLELAAKMHTARLAQLPGELEDALQRSREREKNREDWRRQQEEFGSAASPPRTDEAE